MNLVWSLLAVLILSLIAWGAHASMNLAPLFLVFIPYGAFVVFLAGFVWRIVSWAQSPVPFRIPTTCGQQKTLPWMKSEPLESPSGTAGVIGRMALEVLLFRSLFRNTKAEIYDGPDRLRQCQVALVFRAHVSLVPADHRCPAPALLRRTRRPPDQRPLGTGRFFRNRHADTFSERCRDPSRA